jgi:hypothetical protein
VPDSVTLMGRYEAKRWTPSGGSVAADRQPRYRPAAQAELIEAAPRYEAAADGLSSPPRTPKAI